jgi:hypothetical protein
VLVEAGRAGTPPEAAAVLLAGIVKLAPLPAGNRRLAVLAALHLLARNGLDADLDVARTRQVLDAVAAGEADATAVAAWLGPLVTALDPVAGQSRALKPAAPPPAKDEDDVTTRLEALVTRLRAVDPASAAELEEVVDRHRAGMDRLVHMIRSWRGEIFIDAMARDDAVVALVGRARLESAPAQDVLDRRMLHNYLADIAQYPTLTPEEERALAESARTGPRQNAAASRRRLIQCNLALVVSVARQFQTSGMSLLDLIQEGNFGLMNAVEHYDPAKGYRFTAYATWWVRRYIQRAVGRPPS